jgi:serine/threonine-protein kinase
VTLTVSTAPATVPDVTGKTFSAADEQLTKLGFTVKENPIFDQQKADGLVTGQNPPPDTSNAAEVTLDVVRRPVVTYLAGMEPVNKSRLYAFSQGTGKANGQTYSHALLVTPYGGGDPGSIEYDFSRQYRKLSGKLGMGDKSDSAAVGKVEIYGDGRQLFAQDIQFGTTVDVDLDVTDVLRIKISVSVVDGSGSIIFGDFAAQGLQSEVSASGLATPTTTSR